MLVPDPDISVISTLAMQLAAGGGQARDDGEVALGLALVLVLWQSCASDVT